MSQISELIGTSTEPLLSIREGATLLLIINRPGARNALTRQMRRDFPALVAAADADNSVAALIVTGADPAFSAGVDLKERAAGAEPPVIPHPGDVLRAVRKPVIAAINGPCVTGALEMALSCSFMIASNQARFAGYACPSGPGAALGADRAAAERHWLPGGRGTMMLTGEFIDAGTACSQWGLVNEVVDHTASICSIAASRALGDQIASASTYSVSLQMRASRATAAAAMAPGLEAERESSLAAWDAAQ